MGFRSLVSFGFFIIPVAVTLGLLLGIDLTRHSQGKQSIFVPPPNNKISTDVFCQLQFGFTPEPGRFTFNPDQWGVTEGPGNLCLNVTFYENGTYPSNATSPTFTSTWQYDQGPDTQPVHAFPNAKIEIGDITNTTTVLLSNLTGVPIDVEWSYGPGDEVAPGADGDALNAASLNANVCFDMFLDNDAKRAVQTNISEYEVMIWLGQYGLSTQPIGVEDGIKLTKTINQTVFNLYGGENSNTHQKVFTWLADGNTTNLVGDISPLITQLQGVGGPAPTDHLGYIAFGSEALYSGKNVTFAVKGFSVDMLTG